MISILVINERLTIYNRKAKQLTTGKQADKFLVWLDCAVKQGITHPIRTGSVTNKMVLKLWQIIL